MSNDRGFSLLELLVVLVLVALVSATVVMRWSGVQQRATLKATVEQIEFADAHLRRYAQSHGTSCRLVFDLKNHRLCKQYHNQSQNNPAWESLGRSIKLKEVQSTAQTQQSSQIELTFRRDGTSPTYGLELLGPGQQKIWLIVAGVSGQVTRLETKSNYEDALQLLPLC